MATREQDRSKELPAAAAAACRGEGLLLAPRPPEAEGAAGDVVAGTEEESEEGEVTVGGMAGAAEGMVAWGGRRAATNWDMSRSLALLTSLSTSTLMAAILEESRVARSAATCGGRWVGVDTPTQQGQVKTGEGK